VVKLVLPESETVALQTWMKGERDETFFSSQLLRIELVRTVARVAPQRMARARRILRGFALLEMDHAIVETVESLPPTILRSLDAIHLGTASLFAQSVSAFVAYDARLMEAAGALGLNVVSPA
jgi:predicted nucleic acid-binding protein